LEQLRPLIATGHEFISLQKEVPASDASTLRSMPALRDVSAELTDFAATAALIDGLDRVICVDTAVAHLAGALGKPVWLLLAAVPDWRWLLDRDDSPWYPTVRLFRQCVRGVWDDVIGRVVAELVSEPGP
jgi:ADP-heptose:LPS heptosyltransferase